MARQRVVVDTHVLISGLLLAESVSGQAVRRIVDAGQLLVSDAVLEELAEVLSRPKFDRYIDVEDKQTSFLMLGRVAEKVPIVYPIRACRDPKDDKFLELAVNGTANVIVTGEKDLLALNPFQRIPIITPAQYLEGNPATPA